MKMAETGKILDGSVLNLGKTLKAVHRQKSGSAGGLAKDAEQRYHRKTIFMELISED